MSDVLNSFLDGGFPPKSWGDAGGAAHSWRPHLSSSTASADIVLNGTMVTEVLFHGVIGSGLENLISSPLRNALKSSRASSVQLFFMRREQIIVCAQYTFWSCRNRRDWKCIKRTTEIRADQMDLYNRGTKTTVGVQRSYQMGLGALELSLHDVSIYIYWNYILRSI